MNKKLIYIIGGIVALSGIGVGIYFILRKPKEEGSAIEAGSKGDGGVSPSNAPKDAPKDEQIGGGTKTNPSGCSPLDYKQNISPLSKSKTIANKSGNSYLLGQEVQVKDGATIYRRDANGCNVGSIKTTSRLNLGTIWHINPSGNTIVVKQNKNFSYPFYAMSIEALQ